ncbi:EamA family transporter [Clostridium saccharoperbutylacetonicum]|uniref:EamA family transporter n=1 Tax=Clostridium saccharoperbutylacetonicum TaxID=36745 RepID=UPI0039EB2E20
MYYISMIITVLATVIYNISQKSINQSINPFISMIVTYITAIIFSILALIILPIDRNIISSLKQLNWASYVLGLSALGLEIGYLYLYRSGWNISVAPLFVSIISTIVLIVVGIFIYKTKISPMNTLGICLSIVGLILMNKK